MMDLFESLIEISQELAEANAKEYRMDAPDSIKKAIEGGKAKILKTVPSYLGGKSVFAVIENPLAKGTQHDPVVMAIISDPSRGKIKLFRYFGSHASPTGAMKFAKNNDLLESVELDEKMKYDPKSYYLLLKGKVYGPYRNSDKALQDSDGEGKVKLGSELTSKEKMKLESVELDEVSPPGWEGTVKAMKKKRGDEKIDNPWALAWWMKGKGYKSHYTKDGTKKK